MYSMPKKAKSKTKGLKQKQKQHQKQIVNVNIQQALRKAVRRRRQPTKTNEKSSITQIFRTNEPSAPFHYNYQPYTTTAGIAVPAINTLPTSMGTSSSNIRNLTSYAPPSGISTPAYGSGGGSFQPHPLGSSVGEGLFRMYRAGGAGGGNRGSAGSSSSSSNSVVSNEELNIRTPYDSDTRVGYKANYESPVESIFSRNASHSNLGSLPLEPYDVIPTPSRRRGGANWYWDGDEKLLRVGVPIPEGKYWDTKLGKFKKIRAI